MGHFYKYSVIQLAAHPSRSERLNLGLAIFDNQKLQIHVARNLDKLKALSAAINLDDVRAAALRLAEIDTFTIKQGVLDVSSRLNELRMLSPMEFSPLGQFSAPDQAAFENAVRLLLAKLVEPEPAPAKPAKQRSGSLRDDIRHALRARRILARKGESLDTHRVIEDHVFAEGLSADLLLKNGAMHVMEIVDASISETPVKRAVANIAVSALVFEQARMTFGDEKTSSKLIYHASPAIESSLTPSLMAAEHQGATLVNWASDDQKLSLISELAALAHPYENPDGGMHASAQPKLFLN